MGKIAIRLENVSKKFALRHDRPRSLQELFLFWRRYRNAEPEQYWVLRDLNLQVRAGETLGIIGPNGVGKSTILKLIAGIIVPTSGHIEVSGRVSSLLELGAGFHPDLSGRENIFLYGSLLGLSRATMRQRFDEIVQFSELENFIDVPVKTYSSGMYLRLAFAVAIHVDPEILLIDEILAVGDQSFQAKCMERLATLQSAGVTILLVSHSLGSVQAICDRAAWMEGGRILAEGASEMVVRRYLDAVAKRQSEKLAARNLGVGQEVQRSEPSAPFGRWGSGEVEITRVRLLNSQGQEQYVFVTDESLTVQIHYRTHKMVKNPIFGLAVHRSDGLHVTGPNTQVGNLEIPVIEGEGLIEYKIPRLPLLPGQYQISVAAHNADDTRMFDYHDRLYNFSVDPGGTQERYGLMRLGGQWQHINGQ